jgi:putative membrane protein
MRLGLDLQPKRRSAWDRPAFRFAYGWVTSVVALLVAAAVFSGIDYGSFWTLVVAGLVFSLVNTVVRPLVILLALPAVVLSLGIALLFVNALMLWLTDEIVPSFEVSGFWTAVGGAAIVWLANMAMASVLKPDRSRGRLRPRR